MVDYLVQASASQYPPENGTIETVRTNALKKSHSVLIQMLESGPRAAPEPVTVVSPTVSAAAHTKRKQQPSSESATAAGKKIKLQISDNEEELLDEPEEDDQDTFYCTCSNDSGCDNNYGDDDGYFDDFDARSEDSAESEESVKDSAELLLYEILADDNVSELKNPFAAIKLLNLRNFSLFCSL